MEASLNWAVLQVLEAGDTVSLKLRRRHTFQYLTVAVRPSPVPPFANIDHSFKTRPLVGELPFVNDQTDFGPSASYRFKDLIERQIPSVNGQV